MTTISTPAPTAASITPATSLPTLRGLSHLGLSVVDLDGACDFWVSVMGFEVTTSMPSLRFVVHREARLGIGLTDHAGGVDAAFSELRTGLDHLALAVADAPTLHAWAERLTRLGVPHSPVTETDAGHHLNLRAPDGFPVELFVMAPATATAFGLDAPEEAVARFH